MASVDAAQWPTAVSLVILPMSVDQTALPGSQRFQIEGVDLGYPTEFRDGASSAALFAVDSGAAQRLIDGSGFEIAEFVPGKGILAFTCVRYADTDCGVYEETAQAFFVRRVGAAGSICDSLPAVGVYAASWRDVLTGTVASYTWRLQVTTTLSQQCGLQMWGFPKEIADIDFDLRDGRSVCCLRMEGRDVFRFSVRADGKRSPAPITSTVYSNHLGAPHVSRLTQRYRDTGYALGGSPLWLGDHPLADALRSLGLPKRALLTTWNGHLAFTMGAPVKLRS